MSKRLVGLFIILTAIGLVIAGMGAVQEWMQTPEQKAEALRIKHAHAAVEAVERERREFESLAKYSATAHCEVEIQRRLKAPSTAKFVSEERRIGIDKPKKTVYITGAVDAQNSFGAMIRNKYACEVERSGGQWVTKVAVLVAR